MRCMIYDIIVLGNLTKISEHCLGIVPATRSKYQVYLLARRCRSGESLGLSRSVTSDCHPKGKLDDLSSVYPSLPTI